MFNRKYKKRIAELERLVSFLTSADMSFAQQIKKLELRDKRQKENTNLCPRCGDDSYLTLGDNGYIVQRCSTCNYNVIHAPSHDLKVAEPKRKPRHRK
jgi:ribosomal protein L37E